MFARFLRAESAEKISPGQSAASPWVCEERTSCPARALETNRDPSAAFTLPTSTLAGCDRLFLENPGRRFALPWAGILCPFRAAEHDNPNRKYPSPKGRHLRYFPSLNRSLSKAASLSPASAMRSRAISCAAWTNAGVSCTGASLSPLAPSLGQPLSQAIA